MLTVPVRSICTLSGPYLLPQEVGAVWSGPGLVDLPVLTSKVDPTKFAKLT